MNAIMLQLYDISMLIIYQIKLIVPFWIAGLALGAFLSAHIDSCTKYTGRYMDKSKQRA